MGREGTTKCRRVQCTTLTPNATRRAHPLAKPHYPTLSPTAPSTHTTIPRSTSRPCMLGARPGDPTVLPTRPPFPTWPHVCTSTRPPGAPPPPPNPLSLSTLPASGRYHAARETRYVVQVHRRGRESSTRARLPCPRALAHLRAVSFAVPTHLPPVAGPFLPFPATSVAGPHMQAKRKSTPAFFPLIFVLILPKHGSH